MQRLNLEGMMAKRLRDPYRPTAPRLDPLSRASAHRSFRGKPYCSHGRVNGTHEPAKHRVRPRWQTAGEAVR